MTHEYPPNRTFDSVSISRVSALRDFGLTQRQREFLVTVMVHSGCFLERQYLRVHRHGARPEQPGVRCQTGGPRIRASHRARARPTWTPVPRPPQAALRGDRPSGQPQPPSSHDRPDGRTGDDSRCCAGRSTLLVVESRMRQASLLRRHAPDRTAAGGISAHHVWVGADGGPSAAFPTSCPSASRRRTPVGSCSCTS